MGKSDSGILDASLTTTLVRAARMAAAAAEKALAAENLTLDHWMTLEALASTEGLTMAELRDRTGTPAPTLTRVADKLVSLALIYREVGEDDRRKVRVFLSSRGKSLHKRVAADIRVAEESWLTSKEEVKLREGLRPCAPLVVPTTKKGAQGAEGPTCRGWRRIPWGRPGSRCLRGRGLRRRRAGGGA